MAILTSISLRHHRHLFGFAGHPGEHLLGGHRAFGSAYFLELGLSCQQLEQNIPALFTDLTCGHVLRAKGFVQDEIGWVELNATADGLTANAIPKGQEVLIVIGEGLEKERIEVRLKG